MKLQARLSLTTASTAILALIVVLLVSSFVAKDALEDATREKMLTAQAGRYAALQRYLGDTKAQMEILAAAPSTRESLIEFSQAYIQMGDNAQYLLQQHYVIANELTRQERDRFNITDQPDAYDKIHNQHHERYRNRHRFQAMDDLLLIDAQGNVVYSMLKEKDFATNLLKGPWKDSGLARAVVPLLTSPVPGVASFADFTRHPASDGLPMAFLALPVFDVDNQRFIGVIATKLPYTAFNTLMQDKTGLGNSGETFMVGHDGWMLTDSRFESESTALRKQLKTKAVQHVLDGEDGMISAPDYRGVPSYILYKPVQAFPGALGEKTFWDLLVKTDQDEALRGLTVQRQVLMGVGALLALLASLFSAWVARNVASPIVAIQGALSKLAHGEEAQVPGLDRLDEIGNMAQAAESFRQMSQQIERSHWLNEHLAGLTNLVSSQFSMKEVPEAILNYLCDSMEIPVAALYFRDAQQVYSRVGIHGLARRSQTEDHFALGIGLVGQCARDRQPVILSPVPEGLSIISAGLSEFTPRELVLYPIPHKDEVLGVLELATLHSLTPHQHEFLSLAANGLGLHLANLQAAEHNLTLLAETRHQAEVLAEQRQRIEEASRYARSLIEAALDPLVTISIDGRIMDVNSSTEKVTGVSRQQLIGSDFSNYFTEPDQARKGYQQAFSEGLVTDYPLALRHASGKITDVLYNASVYYDADGKVAGVFAAARDVTEVKQQQEELRKNNEAMEAQQQRIEEASRYARSLIEAALDPLVTIGTKGQIMDVNSATEKITGVGREQLIGSDFSNYFTEPEQARKGYQQVFSHGSVLDYPLALRHVSGKITDVLYNASVYYDADGKVAGVFAAARDVTEVKQQQEALRQNNEEMKALTEELKAQNEEFRANQEELRAQQEEMQHKNQLLESQRRELELARQEAEAKARELGLANQYKSDFLANMSHELRTPLNSILILAKNLSENEEGNLNENQVESAAVINESGTHLLTLINDILDLSKIEAGRFELFNEDFPLNEVMAYLRRTFMPVAEKKRIGFEIELEAGTPEAIHGDRQRITQVLTNLLSNAVKFTDSGQVKITLRPESNHLQFIINDTGIGIPADKIESIFGVFQQVDGSTSRKYGGSGLGLAISKRLIELMGGNISVASTPGRGSTFTVNLPLSPTVVQTVVAPKVEEPRKPAASPFPPRSGAPVLVVEDDSRLVSILQRLIDTLGFAVATVESGEKALEFIAHTKPTGLLLDLGLPGMHGMEVLRKLKMDPITADIPVFIMSGAQDTGEAKTLGALGFLKKPVTKDSIAAAIHTMLEQMPADERQRTVLAIEDNNADIIALQTLFRHDAVNLEAVQTGKEALAWLSAHKVDVIILDLQLPDTSGFDWLHQLDKSRNHPRIVVYSARELTGEELFQLREHADAVVTKGNNNERLHQEVLRLLNASLPQTTLSPPPAPRILGDNRRLLLVDDDVRNLFALAKVLRLKGFRVEVVPSGAKALEMLQQQPFDAVLCDIMMPEMDGYALMGHIRELGYTDLPLIAVTAKAMPGDVERCMEAGANDYVPKPVDIDNLLEVLSRWL